MYVRLQLYLDALSSKASATLSVWKTFNLCSIQFIWVSTALFHIKVVARHRSYCARDVIQFLDEYVVI